MKNFTYIQASQHLFWIKIITILSICITILSIEVVNAANFYSTIDLEQLDLSTEEHQSEKEGEKEDTSEKEYEKDHFIPKLYFKNGMLAYGLNQFELHHCLATPYLENPFLPPEL